MGRLHEFVLVDKLDITLHELRKDNYRIEGKINQQLEYYKDIFIIHDDLIIYMMDTINWIKTKNFPTGKDQFGLSYYGMTRIEKEGLITFADVIKGWIDLFSCGPDEICLQGLYVNDQKRPGQYEKLYFKKKDLLMNLKKCNTLIQMAIKKKYIVLHFGI